MTVARAVGKPQSGYTNVSQDFFASQDLLAQALRRTSKVKILITTKPWTLANAWRSEQRWYYHPARLNDMNGPNLPQIRTEPFGGQGANDELIAEIRGDDLILKTKSRGATSSRDTGSNDAEGNNAQSAE